MSTYHSSLEAVQHGGKPVLDSGELIAYCQKIGAAGVQLSNFHLIDKVGNWLKPADILQALADAQLKGDGISMHCLFWLHGAAWTGTESMEKFLPPNMIGKSLQDIESWVEAKIIECLNLAKELRCHVIPMFWGPYAGLEVASGYPWGLWDLPKGDLVKRGEDRFVKKTAKIRAHANSLGISLAHEIHRGTFAMCARDMLRIETITNCDACIGVNADPSHCWEGEDFEQRFDRVAHLVTGCHVKDFVRVPGRNLSSMATNWKERGMQFCRLGEGEVNLPRYAQLMFDIGYPQRFRKLNGLPDDASVPLIGEAESAYYPLNDASAHATNYINAVLCVQFTTVSFEKDMGGNKEESKVPAKGEDSSTDATDAPTAESESPAVPIVEEKPAEAAPATAVEVKPQETPAAPAAEEKPQEAAPAASATEVKSQS